MKDMNYGNIKSHKMAGLHILSKDTFLEKPQGGQIYPQPFQN